MAVMAGLVPAIHVLALQKKDVDARERRQVYAVCVKQTAMPGHDELRDLNRFESYSGDPP